MLGTVEGLLYVMYIGHVGLRVEVSSVRDYLMLFGSVGVR